MSALCQGLCPPPDDLSSNSFVSQFICLPGPVSGAVSASGGFVSQFIPQTAYCWGTQFYLKMCPPCVRGCVRLPGLCVSHPSPNNLPLAFSILFQAVSGYVQMVVSGSPDVPNSFVPLWQFICLPIWLVVSSSLAVSNSFVCPYINSFPKQFTVGVLNSILKCVRLVSGAVSASGRFVFQFICLPIHLSPRSCVRGCVRLRGICLPIHLSPNSFVSQVLCQGLCPPPGDLSPNSFVRLVSGAVSPSGRFVSQFICLPIHLSPRSLSPNSFPKQFTVGVLNSILKCVRLVSGAVSVSGRFVFQFICLPIHLSPRSCVRGCVRLRGICLPIHLSPNSFVSQVLCQGLCQPPGDLSPNSFVRLVSGAVSASGRFVSQFICLPIHLSPRSLSPNSFVSQVLWQGLCPPPGDWFPNSFVSQFICLPGPVSGAVSAFGGFVSQFVCLPSFPKQLTVGVLNSILRCVRLVSGAVSASLGSVSPIRPQTVYRWRSQFSFKRCPAMFRWWCLALRMSRIHLSPCGNSFVSQSGWWCPALWLSPIHLFALISTHLFPSLAGGVRLFGCLQFICLPLWQLICLPIWLVVSGFGCLQFMCLALWQLISQTVHCWGTQFYLKVCPPCVRGCVRLRTICLPIHLSPNSFVSQVLCQGLCPPPGDLSPNSFPKQLTVGVLNSILRCVRLVSGAVSASLGSVSPIRPQTVYRWRSQFSFKRCPAMFRWWCLALRMSRIHLSPCGNSFVSQSGWWCPALWLSPIHLFALISTHVFPSLAGGVRLFGCLQFICLPLWQLICLPVWLVVSGSSAVSVTLVMSGSLAVSNSFVSKSGWWRLCLPNDSFVSQSGWWCPAFRLAPIHLSPLVTLHLSPSLAGGVRLSGCLQFICFRLVAIHLSPSLAGGVRLSMLSAVSNSFVFPCGN